MRRIVAQVRKELTQIVRDWRTLALALVLPVVMLLLMSAALSLTVSNLPIVVQDFDGSSASNNFIDAFRASISFHVVAWPVDKSAEEALASNAARAVLIIPPHFGRDLARGVQAPVQFMMDASDANTAKLVAGDGSLIAAAYNRQLASGSQAAPVQAAIRLWFNPGSPRKSFTAPESSCLPSPCFRRCLPRWPWPRRPSRRPSFRSTSPASPRTSFCWARFLPSWPSRWAKHSSCLRFSSPTLASALPEIPRPSSLPQSSTPSAWPRSAP